MLKDTLDFGPELLNILSDESFTAPTRLRKNNYGDLIEDPRKFPRIIREQIVSVHGEEASIRCVIVLRNQSDLLYSQYVEEFNLKKYGGVDLIFDVDGNLDLSGYEIYNFFAYHSRLLEVFGAENVSLLFYEEWKENPDLFVEKLAEILGMGVSDVSSSLEGKHMNRKKSNSQGYLTGDGTRVVEFFTSEQKALVRDHFRSDSEKLQALVGSAYDLSHWGYL